MISNMDSKETVVLFLNIENCHRLKIIDVEDLKCINYEIHTEEDLNPFKINREYENWQDKIALQLNGEPH